MKITKLGEFGLIKELQKKCSGTLSDVLTGIGDDAAVVKVTDRKFLITSDMLIEDVHFDLSFTTFFQLGYKFLAVNISDILAMGGTPKYFLVSLGIPGDYDSEDIYELYSGVKKIAGKFGIAIIGGDTCASGQGLVLSGTLIGNANRIVSRSGAKEGDGIFITDTLGDSAIGLQLLKTRGKRVHIFSPASPRLKLIKKHLMPDIKQLKSTSKLTSMIDVSDGLLADLSHICDESKVGAIIYKENIPLSEELRSISNSMGQDPVQYALKGGEDYALLYTARPTYKTNDYKIGEIIKEGRYIIDSKGKKTLFKPEGYEHFKKISDKRSAISSQLKS
ncbi:MAG: thiamine-phosphate kinase [Nitrospirae bacterium]|nr:thiamine-phosphate kinase [Nitrospirota bacterium]